MIQKHTISIIVENEFGVLARVAGLFSGRGYNIESLSVAPSLDPTLSRMTIVTSGDNAVVERIVKQLNKLIHVIKVQDVTSENPINRILSLIKINLGQKNLDQLKAIVLPFQGTIIYQDDRCSIVQIVAEETVLQEAINTLKPFSIMEFVSTGNLAIQKGKTAL